MQVAEASEAGEVKSDAERSEEYALVRFPFPFSFLAVSHLLRHTADELPALLYYRWEQDMYYDGRLPYREQRAAHFIGNLKHCTLTVSDASLVFRVKQAENEGEMLRWDSIEFDVSDKGYTEKQKALLESAKRIMRSYYEQRYAELRRVSTCMVERSG